MFEIIEDAVLDTIKLIPFLFITYLIMEYIENKTNDKTKETIKKSGKFGPLIGGIVGIFPQCGFSVSATNLYAARVISIGTLISVYLSTSDEMLPIFLSKSLEINLIVKILLIKLLIAVICGFIVDFIFKIRNRNNGNKDTIVDLCEHEHCHCHEQGILKSSLKHTLSITLYILITSLIINCLIHLIGEEAIEEFLTNNFILGPIISSLIGLIPNCAASVIITNLYVENVINGACLISGLLTGAGVGIMVLFRVNKDLKENLKIMGIVYGVGVIAGILLQLLGNGF